MVNINKIQAVRLASLFCLREKGSNFGYFCLRPDGSLVATDNTGLIHASDAHDADIEETLFVKPSKQIASSTIEVSIDVAEGVLIERRAKSESLMRVEIANGLKYPDVSRYLPNHLAEKLDPAFGFDSIYGGKIASTYGLDRGFWRQNLGSRSVVLDDTSDGDTVVLGGMTR